MTRMKAGRLSNWVPVKVGAVTLPVAVVVCECVPRAAPVKVCAETVNAGAVALQAVVDPVPAAILVAAQFPVVALAALVPAGVPPETEDDATEFPVKVGTELVPAGVIVSDPPVVPTLPFAATVPITARPDKAETSVHPVGQAALVVKTIMPDAANALKLASKMSATIEQSFFIAAPRRSFLLSGVRSPIAFR